MDILQHKSKCVKYTDLKPNCTVLGEICPFFSWIASICNVSYELIFFFKLEFTANCA